MDPKYLEYAIQIAVLLFAISFHESAHAWTAMKCGDNTARDLGRISMNPIRHIDPIGSILLPVMLAVAGLPVFGWAKPTPVSLRNVRNPRRANLLVSAAGPGSNLLLLVVFLVPLVALRHAAHQAAYTDPNSILIPLFLLARAGVVVNAVLAVFNMVPVPPLDGFHVLESLAPPSLYPVLQFMNQWGFVLFLLLVFSPVLRPLFKLVFWLLSPVL